MLDIRKALFLNIRPPGMSTQLFYDEASEDAEFPYLVFSFEPINTQDEASDRFILNIDGWDAPANGSTVALEQLMRQIDGDGNIKNPTGMNEKQIITDDIVICVRRENRYSIQDSDKTIKRRRYQYQLTSFEIE